VIVGWANPWGNPTLFVGFRSLNSTYYANWYQSKRVK